MKGAVAVVENTDGVALSPLTTVVGKTLELIPTWAEEVELAVEVNITSTAVDPVSIEVLDSPPSQNVMRILTCISRELI